MSDLPRLGPFELLRPLARGAMGEVWHAQHAASGLPVAVKVLTGFHAHDDRVRRSFRDEVRAIASLDHPAIVTLLDAGEVSVAAAEAGLHAGAPWLALEFASDGPVSNRAPTAWPEIRDLALTVLDALAHAHARGIVHRDLKPANLLWCGVRDPRPGLKLTDFGIAVWMGEVEPGALPAGTPVYMAPEQLAGETAGVGPWTDLYSLGCIVWRFVTRALPFDGQSPMQILRAQLARTPPPFQSATPVPRGLEGWLRALLARRPEDRPQRAADAAAALVALDTEAVAGPSRIWRELLERESTVELLTLEEGMTEDNSAPLSPGFVGPPPGIPDWRTPLERRPPSLVGAGLGLVGLREPRVTGRAVEQALLWDELRAVADARSPRAVVITGPVGIGRTRLARWLCARADELGAARVLWGEGGARGGLAATAVRLLRCAGLAGEARKVHLAALVRAPELRDAAEALIEDRLPDEARADVVARLLLARGGERATLLCLDDAHLAEDDLDVIAAALRAPAPVLVVLLAEDEELAARPRAEARLAALPGLRVPLGRLPGYAIRELLGELATLEPPLGAELEERAAGTPGLAVELLVDLVRRDALVEASAGLALRPGAAVVAGFDPHAGAARRRLQRVLDRLPPGSHEALAVAGALGPDVPLAVWRAADARADEVLAVLLDARVGVRTEDGVVLHPHFREAVLAHAREGGHLPRVAAAAAAALPESDDRVGALLLAAGRPEEALERLVVAVERIARVSARRALAVGVDADRAADACGLDPADPRAERLALARIGIDLALGDLASAGDRIAHALARSTDPARRVQLRLLELELCVSRGDFAAAADALAAVRGRTPDPVDHGRALLAEAEIVAAADPEASLHLLGEARERWVAAGLPPDRLARVTWRQARRARAVGDLAGARRLLEGVVADLQRAPTAAGSGDLRGAAQAALAEVLVRLGEPRRAEQLARRAIAGSEAVGAPSVEARLALGLALVAAGDLQDAVIGLEEAGRLAERGGRPTAARQAALGLALAHAGGGTWSLVHDRLRDAERAAADRDPVSSAIALDLAAACHHGGFPQLAARARALAGDPG